MRVGEKMSGSCRTQHSEMSKIVKFGDRMPKSVENIGSQSLHILCTMYCVTHDNYYNF